MEQKKSRKDDIVNKNLAKDTPKTVVAPSHQVSPAQPSTSKLTDRTASSDTFKQLVIICSICAQYFNHTTKYLRHFERLSPLTCSKCKLLFCTYEMLRMHTMLCHAWLMHQCKHCKLICEDDQSYLAHRLCACILMGSFECESCDMSFPTFSTVQRHSILHINDDWHKYQF